MSSEPWHCFSLLRIGLSSSNIAHMRRIPSLNLQHTLPLSLSIERHFSKSLSCPTSLSLTRGGPPIGSTPFIAVWRQGRIESPLPFLSHIPLLCVKGEREQLGLPPHIPNVGLPAANFTQLQCLITVIPVSCCIRSFCWHEKFWVNCTWGWTFCKQQTPTVLG